MNRYSFGGTYLFENDYCRGGWWQLEFGDHIGGKFETINVVERQEGYPKPVPKFRDLY